MAGEHRRPPIPGQIRAGSSTESAALESFSMLGLERRLGLLPWLMVFACWLVMAAVLLFLRHLKPGPEMAQVVAWMLPGSFLVMVPGLGGFVCALMRLRRARTETSLLSDLQLRLGGQVHGGSLMRPLIRPRLLTRVDGTPVEVLLSPPIPRTPIQKDLNIQRAAAEAVIEAVEEALETPEARLGTATWPQLEVRLGIDLPFWLCLSTSPHLGGSVSRLDEVQLPGCDEAEALRILSDDPERAASLLAHHDLREALEQATRFNSPWATQLTLRPAAAGRGAGAYLLTVATDETTAESVGEVISAILEVGAHPAWRRG